jgi:hypothetical protein
LTAGLKGIRIALFLAALMLSVSVFVVVPSADVLTSMAIAGGRPVSGDSSSPDPVIETGIIGNISIANIQPVCMIPQSGTGIVPSPSTSTEVVVTSLTGERTSIPVDWFIHFGCALEGSFQATLVPGTYSLTLSYCLQDPRGAECPNALCGIQSCNLPITVQVESGRLTPVNIGITTGIY